MEENVHFSSQDDTWSTPQDFFDRLDSVFNFTLDPACSTESAKCRKFYTEEDNGLEQSWENEIVFLNPPYSRTLQPLFIRKASSENALTVALIPARTDTKLWHDTIFKYSTAICFIKGRLKFGNAANAAPFPSAIVVFGENPTREQIRIMKEFGRTIIQ